MKHKQPDFLDQTAAAFASELRKKFSGRVMGPEYPVVSKIRNYYLKDILVKLDRNATLPAQKTELEEICDRFFADRPPVRLVIDVDPV